MICPVSTLFNENKGVCESCGGGNYRNAVINRCNRGSAAASLLSAVESTVRDWKFDYMSHIDHFFMVSKFCREKHIEYLPEIADKSSVLYNFVNFAEAEGGRKQGPSTPVRRQYLYCGRLSKEKGVRFLCEEFANRLSDTLRIAGDGPLAEELRSRYAHCGNIEFLGKLNSEELKAEISRAWFTIVPSEWYENNPMSVLESFAQGVPVLGAAIGGIPELVIDESTGYLFKPSDKTTLAGMLDKAGAIPDATRAHMAENCVALVRQRHSAESHYRELLEGYAHVISAGKAPIGMPLRTNAQDQITTQ
jgi:glycosyltransferase involved in cell wall biosynthesis